MDYGLWSLAIPLLTVIVAIVLQDVIVTLLLGSLGVLLVTNSFELGTALVGLADGIITTLSTPWVTKTILFSLLIGAFLEILQANGAIERFVGYVDSKAKAIDSPKGAQWLAFFLGIVIFIESSITSLIAGAVAKPLCKKNGISPQRLAYICDATSAPVCSLVPLNAWGALLLGLIASSFTAHHIDSNPLELLVGAIGYNLYAIVAILLVALTIAKDIDIAPMVGHTTAQKINTTTNSKGGLVGLLLPVVGLLAMVVAGLYYTGKGDIFKGSGSSAIYYATLLMIAVLYIVNLFTQKLSAKAFIDTAFGGMGKMLPVASVLLLAIYIGKLIGTLGTAHYLSALMGSNMNPALLPLALFWVSALIAFSTGTSWGTFSIMMPIAITLGIDMEMTLSLCAGAIISGGIFGDHASAISDTTIISSMASECDPIEHVKSQLPYALIGAAIASVGFIAAGYAQ